MIFLFPRWDMLVPWESTTMNLQLLRGTIFFNVPAGRCPPFHFFGNLVKMKGPSASKKLLPYYVDVSENSGFSPQIIHGLIGFVIIFTIHFGISLFLETPIPYCVRSRCFQLPCGNLLGSKKKTIRCWAIYSDFSRRGHVTPNGGFRKGMPARQTGRNIQVMDL